MKKDLKTLRKKIDQIDEQLIALINHRAQLAQEIGEKKLSKNKGVYSPDREANVYERALNVNKGPIGEKSVKAIFREIMSASIALEKKIKVAYLGPSASFTNQASIEKFGSSVEYVPLNNIADVFFEVERSGADYGVVPIENTTEGAVTHTLDMFVESDLKICSEIFLPISHALLGKSKIKQIKKIYSNPQVFGQCRTWLRENLANVQLIDVSSTSYAAEIASRQKDSAAIASELAARIYRLKVLARQLQDYHHNYTRFLVIGKEEAMKSGKDKTSILFSIKDKVGALYKMLLPFRRNGINLTKIESRPSKVRPWEYYFFIDCAGHISDERVKKALTQLEKICIFMKVLGSYPLVSKD